MDLTHALKELSRLKPAVIAVVALAILAGLWAAFDVSLFPPSLKSKSYEYGAANTQVIVDGKRSPVVDIRQEFEPLATRAEVYARLITSTPVKNYIGRDIGMPGNEIIAEGPPSPDVTRAEREPLAAERSNALRGEGVPYRLSLRPEDELPILNIASQAPTAEKAVELADAAVAGLMKYVENVQETSAVREGARVRLRQLGPAQGGTVNSGVNKTVPVLAFMATLVLGLALVLGGANVLRNWREVSTGEASAYGSGATVSEFPTVRDDLSLDEQLATHGLRRARSKRHSSAESTS
jgi:hypothetical protein